MSLSRVTWLLPAALLLGSISSSAQEIRPGDERQELPEFRTDDEVWQRDPLPRVPSFEPERSEPGDALPPIELPHTLSGGAQVTIREVRIAGNTAISDATLHAIAEPYLARDLTLAEVQQLRDELTGAYLREGYLTSGAVIPPQDIDDGVLEVQIIEGRLSGIEVETDGRFRERYLRSRLAQGAGPPVDVDELHEQLQILQQDDRIRSVHAQLLPTEQRGETQLRVEVEEESPLFLTLAGNDYTTPSLGEWGGEIGLGYRNVTGFGDVILSDYEWSQGLHDVRGSYAIPFTVWDTRLVLSGRGTWSKIVEDPFDDLDIKNETQSYTVGLFQPVLHTPSALVELFVLGEYRRSESFLFDEPDSFSPGPVNGVAKLALVRGGALWTYRSAGMVWAVRGQVTGGVDALHATTHREKDIPDGRFVAGLLQLQWAMRLPWLGMELIARAEGQIANQPLLGIEQFAIGGRYTVRGYRENQLVRDNGVTGSVELRVPIPMPRIREWRPTLTLAPFYDIGYGDNNDRGSFDEGDSELLDGVGIGALVGIAPGLDFEVYWGEALRSVPQGGEHSLQDDGVYMELRWTFGGWPW